MSMKQALIIAGDYPYGYCEVGQRFYALKSGKRTLASQLDCGIEAGEFVCTDDREQEPAIETCLRSG